MKKYFFLLFLLVILAGAGYVSYRYYSYLFAKDVRGVIVKVERVTTPEAIISMGGGAAQIPNNQIFSFAIAIRTQGGEIHTASTEDRQWAVATAGQCVDAKFYPYPPWQLDKSGTYFGARLLRLYDCPK